MSDIFISYSRKDIAYARILHEGLQAQDLETWIDWQDIPTSTEWMQEIYTAIEEANTVVFILSASSILSEVCNEEIEHARENNKRIIPVVIDDVDPGKVHPALAAINWIFSRTQDELQPALDSLIEAIQTDYDWVKAHTRLQVRALEWERERQDRSYLLHGTDLHQAEDWLAESVAKAPEPTLTQTRYIQFSRQEAMKRQRRSLISIGAALIITLVLGIIAVINGQRAQQNALSLATQVAIAEEQRGIAEEQKGIAEEQKGIAEENAHLAHIRELTAISQQSGIRFDVAMLLGAESFNEIENFQTSNNLFKLNLQYPKVSRIIMHEGVRSVAISPDGKILASGSADGSIMLWDMASVQPLSDLLRGHDSTVWTLDFSPDGKWLVSGSEDQMIILWDVDSGQEIERINTSMDIRNVAFSPDGRTIASIDASDQGGHVVLWDVDSMQAVGEPLGEFWGGTGEVAFSPDGEKLACGFGNVMIWDLSGEQPIAEPLQGNPEQVMTIAFNPDGKILATAGEDVDSLILLWDVESKQLIGEPLEGHSSEIISLAFSPDGDTLASGSRDRTIVLWNAASGQAIGEPLSAHIARISEIAFGPDGTTLASASEDDTIILWNVEGAAYSKEIVPLENSGVTRDGLSADGKILASVDDDGAIHLMDIESGQPFGEPLERQEEGSVSRVAFSPDMSTIASMDEDNSINLWNASTGMRIAGPLREHVCAAVWCFSDLAFSPDGKMLASTAGNEDSEIILRDAASGQPIGDPLESNLFYVLSITFSPDGKTLAAVYEGGVLLWDVDTRQRLYEPLQGHTDWVLSAAFSPDGKILASGGWDGTVILWDTASGRRINEPLRGSNSEGIAIVAFNPTGDILASGLTDGTIIFWDIASGMPMGPVLQAHSARIQNIAFSSDGEKMISTSFDGSAYIWDVDPESWIERVCEKVSRNFTQEEWSYYFPGEPYRKTCAIWPEGE